MDYAIQLLLPILGGLALGFWLTEHYGVSPIWMVILAILGMVGGIGILYKRFSYPELYPDAKKPANPQTNTTPVHHPHPPKATHLGAPKNAPPAPGPPKSLPLEELAFLYEEPNHQQNRRDFDLDLDESPPDDTHLPGTPPDKDTP